ncbi:hypothetical protein [Ramlibacter sp.]|uniref:hypothetical protein n=1 Tax=Ramlibacter sp. TaxID=1917967 RepID=UPI003D13863F
MTASASSPASPASPSSPFALALAQLEPLVRRHAEALVAGDADALPELQAQIRKRLALLSAASAGQTLPADCRPILERLVMHSMLSRPAAARRLEATDRAIAVFGSMHEGVRQRQASRVYAANGVALGPWRAGGFERA